MRKKAKSVDKVSATPSTTTDDGSRKGLGCAKKLRGRVATRRSCLWLSIYFLLEFVSFIILVSFPNLLSVITPPALAEAMHNFDVKGDDTADIVELPPLEELIDRSGTVIGDISWMLDFAVIAFPKAGTSFVKDYLNKTEETYVYEREFCMKHHSDVSDFVRKYHELHVRFEQPKYPKTIQFGLKCPGVFYRAEDIHFYERYFPSTKFIIGLRHPVSWFESFYNYQSYRNVSLPNTSQLIGRCTNHQKVCTDRARFAPALARLGKTPMRDDEELNLLLGLRHAEQQQSIQQTREDMHDLQHRRHMQGHNGMPNRVLLYEVRQLHREDASKEISASMRRYLGIHEDFPAILPYKQNKTRAIDICDEEHDEVRRLLVEHGTDALAWIKEYFLKSPGVEVASQNSFHRLMGDWSMDPCQRVISF